nr:MAG TPA: hypothetical protein [Caudoviricetes sp.]
MVNTKAPFRNSVGTVTTKSVSVSKEWHLHNATNIDDVLAAIKAGGFVGNDHTTQSISTTPTQGTVGGQYKSMSTDARTNMLENMLMQLYSILSKAPPIPIKNN